MQEISVSITYKKSEHTTNLYQIEFLQKKFIPEGIEVLDITFEKEWLPEKTKVTFKGVEK